MPRQSANTKPKTSPQNETQTKESSNNSVLALEFCIFLFFFPLVQQVACG
jgi:hypothetical protein